jgi:hypothetical protein
MNGTDVLIDGLDRVRGGVHRLVDGLDPDELTYQPRPGANTIGWQVWHLTRGTDAQVADLDDTSQLWTTGGFAERLGFDPDPGDTGYGHTPEQAAAVRIDQMDLMLGYLDEVIARSVARLRRLSDEDLDRVVDRNWEPPVTEGVRWVSIIGDCLQHIGQANYVKGMLVG